MTNSTKYNTTQNSQIVLPIYLIFEILMTLVTIPLNVSIIIIILIVLSKKLCYSDLLFLFNSILQLITGCISYTFMTNRSIFNDWPQDIGLCRFWMINDYSIFTVNSLIILLISIHRLEQLITSNVSEKLSKIRIIKMVTVWLVPFLFWGLMLLPLSSTDILEDCDYTSDILVISVFEVIMLSVPSISVVVLNIIIFFKLKQKIEHNKKIGHVDLEPEHHHHQHNKSKHGHNLLNLRDMRAFMCILSLTLTQLVCNLVFSFMWTLSMACDCVGKTLWDVITWINYSNALFNPLFLFLFHEKYKRAFKYLFKKLKKLISVKKRKY